MRVLVASNNPHKLEEFRRILHPLGYTAVSPADEGIAVEVEETGRTFEENARLKARAFASRSGLPAVADDSGLIIDALDGEPGIYSARYGGPGLTDAARCRLILDRLSDVPLANRSARFAASITYADQGGREITVGARVEGVIAHEPRGVDGFGYDPIFLYPPTGKTFAEMAPAQKDAVSHRGAALRRLAEALSGRFDAGILR